MTASWRVAGSYFESCNCDAICPCRRTTGVEGGRSTHGVCDFALSWMVDQGHHGDEKLDGLAVVMVGSYKDLERWTPWRVALLVDELASMRAQSALSEIFLGEAGGTPMANYTRAIGEIRSIRPAKIRLDHRRGHERIDVESAVEVEAGEPASADGSVSCGIPGHDHPGTEVRAKLLSVKESDLDFRYSGVCGFTTRFDYSSDT
jgi:hypothetical protein